MNEMFDDVGVALDEPAEPRPGRRRPVRAPAGGMTRVLVVLAILGAAAVPGYSLYSKLTQRPSTERAAKEVAAGLAAHSTGRLDQADRHYRAALVLDPRNKFAHYNLGLLAQTRGDKMAAERFYRVALAIDPGFAIAMYNLAIVRTDAGAAEEAIDLYRRVILLEPKNAAAHLNLGFLLARTGKQAEANTEFAAAVALDPKLASRVPSGSR